MATTDLPEGEWLASKADRTIGVIFIGPLAPAPSFPQSFGSMSEHLRYHEKSLLATANYLVGARPAFAPRR